jgi:hypothetical protein
VASSPAPGWTVKMSGWPISTFITPRHRP